MERLCKKCGDVMITWYESRSFLLAFLVCHKYTTSLLLNAMRALNPHKQISGRIRHLIELNFWQTNTQLAVRSWVSWNVLFSGEHFYWVTNISTIWLPFNLGLAQLLQCGLELKRKPTNDLVRLDREKRFLVGSFSKSLIIINYNKDLWLYFLNFFFWDKTFWLF